MKKADRAELKEFAREQLEARIQHVQQSVIVQFGGMVRTRRRDIIAVLEAQYQQVTAAFKAGQEPTTLSREEFTGRMSIMDEVIVQLKAVPEV